MPHFQSNSDSDDSSCISDSSVSSDDTSGDSMTTISNSTNALKTNTRIAARKNCPSDRCSKIMFSDTAGLCDDLRAITELSDLCDVRFLVGKESEEVYGVRAIMATRSRYFYQMFLSTQNHINESDKKSSKRLSLLSKVRKLASRNKKKRNSSDVLTIRLVEVDPGTFRDVITYLHSGKVDISLDNVIATMNTAHSYGLTDLRCACFDFATRCVNLDSVLTLLTSTLTFAERKWTKILTVKIWDFITENAQLVLELPEFGNIPKEAAILIFTRPRLSATEEDKRTAAKRWCSHQFTEGNIADVDETFQELMSVDNCHLYLRAGITEDVPAVDFSEETLDNHSTHVSDLIPDKSFKSASCSLGNCPQNNKLFRDSLSSDSGLMSSAENLSLP